VWLLRLGLPGDLSHACVAIVGGGALASCGSVAVLLWLMIRDFRQVRPTGENLQMGRRLLRFCVPVALNDYLRSGLGTLEQFLIPHGLARSGGSRTQALADYGTIQGMVFPVMMLPSTVLFAVADLLVPRLARCRAEQDFARTHRIAGQCLQASLLFGGAVAGLLCVLALPLGQLLYDSADAGRYLRLFAPLVPMLYLDCIVDGMHKGLGQQIYCVRVNTLTNLLDVIGLFLLLPRYGIGGYVFTYTVTHAVNCYLSLRKLLELTGVQLQIRFLFSAAACVCGAAAVCSFVPLENRWVSVLTAGGIYLVVLALLLTLTGCSPVDKPAAMR